jgi:hypothetical protein
VHFGVLFFLRVGTGGAAPRPDDAVAVRSGSIEGEDDREVIRSSLRARPLLVACGAGVSLSLLLGAGPARADDDPADGLMVIAQAAAEGAAAAANQALARNASAGMSELGKVAAVMELPAAKPTARKKAPVVQQAGSLSWAGWRSGAAGKEAENGSFGQWRGEPLGVVGVWADSSLEAQRDLDAVDAYADYDGDMDVAVGGLVRGETWQQAADGAFVDRWTTAMRNLKAKRAGKGTTYVRIAHEFNGDWMPWGMTSKDLAAYKAGYRLYASIVRKEFPQARLTWSPNGGNHTDVSIDELYPGNDVVDVIGPDIYDGFPDVTSPALWKQSSSMWSTADSPRGLAAWQQYAARKGKPLALPEWGLPYGDHPEFIKGVHSLLSEYAASPGKVKNAGRVVYDVYFNVEDKFKIYQGPNTSAGAAYAALTWGS